MRFGIVMFVMKTNQEEKLQCWTMKRQIDSAQIIIVEQFEMDFKSECKWSIVSWCF